MTSEVAKMRRIIEQEAEALGHVFNGPSNMGGHDFVSARYRILDAQWEELAKQVGEQNATELMGMTLEKAMQPK